MLLPGCVSSYDPTLVLGENLVVVNGIITDQVSPQVITLSRARSNADSSLTSPIHNATVEILVDGGTSIALSEIQTQFGSYQLPDVFRGRVGSTYQLRFRTTDGVTYESSVETMIPVAPIQRVYDQPHGQAIALGDTVLPASDIYVDYQDPPGAANFYLWRWRNYETQDWCATCRQGRYVVTDVGPVGSGPLNVLGCVLDTTIRSYVSYDYPCRSLCWDIFYNTTTDIFSDVYTNGRLQVGHRVATIPAYQNKAGLIVVEQLSLSANAYRYYKLFAEQTQNTGTLADSPPAPIVGNVKNLANALENVVGYFSAASVSVRSLKFTRQNLTLTKSFGLFRLENNRYPSREVDRVNPIFGSLRPSALCISSQTRTDQLPPGW